MKNTSLLLLTLVGSLLVYSGWDAGIHSRVISRETATRRALAQLGDGTLRNFRLDRTEGMPVWELKFTQPKHEDIIEIRVHALTGEIVSMRSESLQKANRELAEVAKHIGITAEHISSLSGDRLSAAALPDDAGSRSNGGSLGRGTVERK